MEEPPGARGIARMGRRKKPRGMRRDPRGMRRKPKGMREPRVKQRRAQWADRGAGGEPGAGAEAWRVATERLTQLVRRGAGKGPGMRTLEGMGVHPDRRRTVQVVGRGRGEARGASRQRRMKRAAELMMPTMKGRVRMKGGSWMGVREWVRVGCTFSPFLHPMPMSWGSVNPVPLAALALQRPLTLGQRGELEASLLHLLELVTLLSTSLVQVLVLVLLVVGVLALAEVHVWKLKLLLGLGPEMQQERITAGEGLASQEQGQG